MHAEKHAPLLGRHGFARKEDRHHGRHGRHDEKHPHQPRDLSHPALQKRDEDRKQQRHGDGQAKPKMNDAPRAAHLARHSHKMQQGRRHRRPPKLCKIHPGVRRTHGAHHAGAGGKIRQSGRDGGNPTDGKLRHDKHSQKRKTGRLPRLEIWLRTPGRFAVK